MRSIFALPSPIPLRASVLGRLVRDPFNPYNGSFNVLETKEEMVAEKSEGFRRQFLQRELAAGREVWMDYIELTEEIILAGYIPQSVTGPMPGISEIQKSFKDSRLKAQFTKFITSWLSKDNSSADDIKPPTYERFLISSPENWFGNVLCEARAAQEWIEHSLLMNQKVHLITGIITLQAAGTTEERTGEKQESQIPDPTENEISDESSVSEAKKRIRLAKEKRAQFKAEVPGVAIYALELRKIAMDFCSSRNVNTKDIIAKAGSRTWMAWLTEDGPADESDEEDMVETWLEQEGKVDLKELSHGASEAVGDLTVVFKLDATQ